MTDDQPIIVTHLDTADAAHEIRGVGGNGVFVVDPAPTAASAEDIYRAILDSLDKNPLLSTRRPEPRAAASAWLRHTPCKRLVICDAQFLHAKPVAKVGNWFASLGIQTVWMYGLPAPITNRLVTPEDKEQDELDAAVEYQRAAKRANKAHAKFVNVTGFTSTPMDIKDFPSLAEPTNQNTEPVDTQPNRFPVVPRVDGAFFRSNCRTTLTAPEFAVVDRAVLTILKRLEHDVAVTSDSNMVRPFQRSLLHIIDEAATVDEAIVAARAAQIFGLRHGWFIKVNIDTLVFAVETLPSIGLAERQDWAQAFDAYADPTHPAMTALSIAGFDGDQIAAITIDQLTLNPDGSFTATRITPQGNCEPECAKHCDLHEATEQRSIDGAGARFLRVYLDYRQLAAQSYEDRLFFDRFRPCAPRGNRTLLRSVSSETGITCHQARLQTGSNHTNQRLAALGIKILRPKSATSPGPRNKTERKEKAANLVKKQELSSSIAAGKTRRKRQTTNEATRNKIIKLSRQGRYNYEIAAELGLTSTTVAKVVQKAQAETKGNQ